MSAEEFSETFEAKIKVVGVGGAGCNVINTLVEEGVEGAELIAVNTDAQALEKKSKAPVKLQIGAKITRGLGAGGDPTIGRKSAEEDQKRIKELLSGANMVFVTAGMGGGTGTGAAPVVAKIARDEVGALTVGIVTKPFFFEGKRRADVASRGIDELRKYVDTLIVISNDKLFEVCGKNVPVKEAFRKVDEVLVRAVKSITEIITVPAIVNIDFADVKAVMKDKGYALIGIGEEEGDAESRTRKAAEKAIQNPLLDGDIKIDGATDVLVLISGGENLMLHEAKDASEFIKEKVSPDANIIWGLSIEESMGNRVRVIVVATGIENQLKPVTAKTKNFSVPESVSDIYDIPAFIRRKQKQ